MSNLFKTFNSGIFENIYHIEKREKLPRGLGLTLPLKRFFKKC